MGKIKKGKKLKIAVYKRLDRCMFCKRYHFPHEAPQEKVEYPEKMSPGWRWLNDWEAVLTANISICPFCEWFSKLNPEYAEAMFALMEVEKWS